MNLKKFTAVTTATSLAVILTAQVGNAQLFQAKDVEQDDHIAIAAPFGDGNYQLLVVEQLTDERQCWDESGSEPVVVEPLLQEFDFTGICGRATDTNGYSIRVDGRDMGQRYNLSVVERDDELLLVGRPRNRGEGEPMVVGRTHGLAEGEYLKFDLEPGWSFARRTFEDRTLGHYYLAKTTVDMPFADARQDLYVREIAQAVDKGFISGFEDETFRPTDQLTREQVVSMVINALEGIPELELAVSDQADSDPYPDVEANRWSSGRITWAKENDIIAGYDDGTFRPTDPVTRAELIVIENRAIEYVRNQLGETGELATTEDPINFADMSGHWAEDVVTQMSAYCGVASPLNEQGNDFAPNEPAQRNYAAAATVRMLDCLQSEEVATLDN
ncbi:DUF3747 domain-containing protein [Euhalothece natronophila Z-M001]|uniref:DUF3747 domain-containing protein n=1 Tax=Euhalothece natronophila Z-M001 TaxID=522448 RepID=A0A5B8NIC6_9CHRO|nr:DUF3747 domain-containing protein [Euhalothece natronophila]QDZ38677.1 DUF3747 domain-containing protein [Euhalothece natronophila Z-M001]